MAPSGMPLALATTSNNDCRPQWSSIQQTLPESEAESRLNALRLGVRTDIAKALSTFPSQWDRQGTPTTDTWRMIAMCSPRGHVPEMSEASLVLPPLQPLLRYDPASSSRTASPTRSRRLKAPMPSQLNGAADSLSEEGPKVHVLILEDTAQAVAQRRLVLARQRASELEKGKVLSCQEPLPRSTTVCLSKANNKIRGVDPMAGGLFSRNAQLDPLARKMGLYEATLHKKAARAGVPLRAPHSAR